MSSRRTSIEVRKNAQSMGVDMTSSLSSSVEVETDQVSGKYPRTVLIMLGGNALISFSSSAWTVLIIYMTDRCHYSEDEAAMYFHLYLALTLLVPVVSGIFTDTCCSKFIVILYGLLFGTFGYVSLTVGSVPRFIYTPKISVWVCFICRIIGMGSVSNLVPLQVEQFNYQYQKKYVSQFFQIYLIINNTALILSRIIYPILRDEIHCYDLQDCYMLIFTISTFLLVIVVCSLVVMEPFLKISKPRGSKLILVTSCTCYALGKRFRNKFESDVQIHHWLDYASEKYNPQLIIDMKILYEIFGVVFVIPFTYASLFQVKSSWIFQARLMNGYIGFMYIKPEQMLALHSLCCMFFVPVYINWFEPCLRKFGVQRDTTLILIGSTFVLVAYIMSATLQLLIEQLQPAAIKPGFGELRIINTLDCTYKMALPNLEVPTMEPMQLYTNTAIKVKNKDQFKIRLEGAGPGCPAFLNKEISLEVFEKKAMTYVLDHDEIWSYEDIVNRSIKGYPYIRIIGSKKSKHKNIKFITKHGYIGLNIPFSNSSMYTVYPSMNYAVHVDGTTKISDVQLKTGAVYNFVINSNATAINQHVLVNPNSIHMMWQTPQIVVMIWGTVITDISLHQFLFSQSPPKLRSVSWAYGMLLRSLGNFIIMIFKSIRLQKKWIEYLMFCGMQVISIGILALLLCKYRYQSVT